MKKLILALSFAFALVSFCSCSKEGTDPKDKLDDRLVGTKWQTSAYAHKIIWGGDPYDVYDFISTTEVEHYMTEKGSVKKSYGTYTYTLDYPKITINVKDDDGTVKATHYTFKDTRTMVRDDLEESKPYAKFIKQ